MPWFFKDRIASCIRMSERIMYLVKGWLAAVFFASGRNRERERGPVLCVFKIVRVAREVQKG